MALAIKPTVAKIGQLCHGICGPEPPNGLYSLNLHSRMNIDPTAIPSLALQVVLKEYEMLRLEINMFNQYRQQLMYSSVALLAAILTALATASTSAAFEKWLQSPKNADAYGVVYLVSSVVVFNWRSAIRGTSLANFSSGLLSPPGTEEARV